MDPEVGVRISQTKVTDANPYPNLYIKIFEGSISIHMLVPTLSNKIILYPPSSGTVVGYVR